MNAPRISVLTPPGTGAIAVLELAGEGAWAAVRQLWRANRSLPDRPEEGQYLFGSLGEGVQDEVVVAVKRPYPDECVEIHCHGGWRVVRWLVGQFERLGVVERPATSMSIHDMIAQARTLKTASILLDQELGAFRNTLTSVLMEWDTDPVTARSKLTRLAQLAPIGRHLITPWTVVIAGPPNAGKSSLINALAGFERAVVSPIPGTTRDTVSTNTALNGWPVQLIDTAGLRRTADELEGQGIARAKSAMEESDCVIWLIDGSAADPALPDGDVDRIVINKIDLPSGCDESQWPKAIRVSARTGEGIAGLIAALVRFLVPVEPEPGEAVPYTPELAEAVLAAANAPDARDAIQHILTGRESLSSGL